MSQNNDSISKICLTGNDLTLSDLAYAHSPHSKMHLELPESTLKEMIKSRNYVLKLSELDSPTYGINTGFGALSSVQIPREDLGKLQYNLIRSHCTGVGNYCDKNLTKILMIIRANCLAKGYSGVNPDIVKLLCRMVENDITPLIPEKGSVGASGDLAPLAHLALSLIGEGEVSYNNNKMPALQALKMAGLSPITLGPKDGLALINGTALMAALGAVAYNSLLPLAKIADIVTALSVDGLRGTDSAFHPLISFSRPHQGQIQVSKNIRKLLSGSQILKSHLQCERVQDPYSLRCGPQVHGPVRDILSFAKRTLEIEINSATDNPLIFPDENLVLSGGNFHGEALAMCFDYLCIAASELCSISERRVEKLMNPSFSKLPAFLTQNSGLNSGMMIAHVTHASLVSENKVLSHPASVDSIPTSTDKEDHVSMGPFAGRKLLQVIENLKFCLSIELLCNTLAIDFLRPLKSSEPLEKVHQLIRSKVPPIKEDRVFHHDINNIKSMIDSGELLREVEAIVGILE